MPSVPASVIIIEPNVSRGVPGILLCNDDMMNDNVRRTGQVALPLEAIVSNGLGSCQLVHGSIFPAVASECTRPSAPAHATLVVSGHH